jgi:hypothetical protein
LTFACRAATGFIGVTESFERRSLSDDAEMVLEADESLGGFDCCIDIFDTTTSFRVVKNECECLARKRPADEEVGGKES